MEGFSFGYSELSDKLISINVYSSTLPNHQILVTLFLTLIHLTNFHHCSNTVNKSDEKTLFGKACQVFVED